MATRRTTWSTIKSYSMRTRISVPFTLQFLPLDLLQLPTESPPLQAAPSSTDSNTRKALSGIPNAYLISRGWMGKQVSAIYHSPSRKRARQGTSKWQQVALALHPCNISLKFAATRSILLFVTHKEEPVDKYKGL